MKAKSTKNTKNTKKTITIGNPLNNVNVRGVVTKVIVSTDKVAVYNLDIQGTTPKGNTSHCWVNVVDFDRDCDYEDGDVLTVSGSLETNKFESEKHGTQYSTRIVASSIGYDEEVPYN